MPKEDIPAEIADVLQTRKNQKEYEAGEAYRKKSMGSVGFPDATPLPGKSMKPEQPKTLPGKMKKEEKPTNYRKGGFVRAADGIAKKGKTKGRIL